MKRFPKRKEFSMRKKFSKKSSNVGVIRVFSPYGGGTHMGLKKRRKFQKSRDFFGGFKWGLYFSWFFFEKSCWNVVNQYFSLWEKYGLTNDWSVGFMTPFQCTSKADFCVLKIRCVLKIFSRPRPHKNSPATGVRFLRKAKIYRSFSAKEPCDEWLFCEKWPAT